MKKIEVVAAIIIRDGKLFTTQRGVALITNIKTDLTMKDSKKDIGKSLLIGALLSAAYWKIMKLLDKKMSKE